MEDNCKDKKISALIEDIIQDRLTRSELTQFYDDPVVLAIRKSQMANILDILKTSENASVGIERVWRHNVACSDTNYSYIAVLDKEYDLALYNVDNLYVKEFPYEKNKNQGG